MMKHTGKIIQEEHIFVFKVGTQYPQAIIQESLMIFLFNPISFTSM